MNVLEKILEEIETIGNIQFSRYTELLISVKDVENIIRSHINKTEKVLSAEIVSHEIDGKPYYEIKYKKVGGGEYHIGYGSYDLKNVVKWLNECFEFCGEAKVVVNNGKDTNVPSNESWIPVEERLPEANEIVMVTVHSSEWVSDFDTSFVPEEEKKFHPERYDVFVGCLRENREWIFFDESMSETSCEKEFGNDKGYIYSVVSAWCPFPEPYKPEEN